jgi:Tfp pilus assembly protein PilV
MTNTKKKTGVTLLEIIFATTILAMALLPIAGIMGQGLKATSKDYRMLEGIQLLESNAQAVLKSAFDGIPVGNNQTTLSAAVLATAPLRLGTVSGKHGTTYNASLDCQTVAVSFSARPVKVYAANFVATCPVAAHFEDTRSYSFGNLVKRITLRVQWQEPQGPQRTLTVVTFLAKTT